MSRPSEKPKDTCSSMTGFARKQITDGEVTIEIDLRSVNHRYLELGCRLPREYNTFEGAVRSILGERLRRGKIDCSISRKSATRVSEDLPSAARIAVFMRAYADYARDFGIHEDKRADLLKELLLRREPGAPLDAEVREGEREAVLELLKQAVDELVTMRRAEGANLLEDLNGRIRELQSLRSKISESAEMAPESFRRRITEKVGKLSPEVLVDPGRLAAEVAIMAEKVDISEELVRLVSHFEQITSAFAEPPSGRKVDFLIQECVREFNTIGSKAQDAKIQTFVVEAKVTLEKMREQVQNLE